MLSATHSELQYYTIQLDKDFNDETLVLAVMYSFAVIILINFIEKTSVSSIHFNFCFHAKFTFVSFASHLVFSIISTRQSKRAQIQNTRYWTRHY